MKILFVEDNIRNIEIFENQLSHLGQVFVFKSSNKARNWLNDNSLFLDLVVCDHHILRFEGEPNSRAFGNEVYWDLRYLNPTVPFVHFSAEPCPAEYEADEDGNFYSIKKNESVNLLKFILDNGLKK